MKGAGSLLLFSFLIFGILLNSAILLADNNDSNNSGSDSNLTVSATNNSDDDKNETQIGDGEDDDHEDDACEEISGETFRSVRQQEVGLGLNTSNNSSSSFMRFWSISFEKGHFSWSHSDVVEKGLYVCDKGAIVGNSTSGKTLTGNYNKDKNILLWQGIEYAKKNDDHEDDEKDNDKNRTKIKTKEIITRGNCTIKIEKTIKIEEGKRVETVKRKIKCADGTEAEVKIKVENRTDDQGRIREKIKYEFKGRQIDVDTEDGISLQEETNTTEYRLKAIFRGNVTDIRIMPDEAAEIALERLRGLNLTNFTVDLREGNHNNIPKVVYNVETNKHGRFLGVFKLKLKVRGEVDPVTGEFLGTSKPWWAFLVTGEDSEQSDNVDEGNVNNTSNETVNASA